MPVLPPQQQPVPGSLTNAGASGSFKCLDIIRMAMAEIGAIDPREVPDGQEAITTLYKLNRLIDSWNADQRFVYANKFIYGLLTPNLQPHLIGPGGSANFNQADGINQRPVEIVEANILLNANAQAPFIGQATVRVNVTVHQDKGSWWSKKIAPGIQSVIPTDMYYEPDWPNGSMFLWVVPTVAYPLELLVWTVLQQYGMDDVVYLPPGYLDGLVYDLAKSIAPSFQMQWTPLLEDLRRTALRRIQGPNLASPTFGTRDSGLPGKTTGTRSDYNYLTKQVSEG